MSRRRTALVISALTAMVAAGAQGQTAFGASSASASAGSRAATPAATAPVTRLSDFNRDGSTDLVATDKEGSMWIYPGNGSGGFLARHRVGGGWTAIRGVATPGDVTGDGNADVVASDSA